MFFLYVGRTCQNARNPYPSLETAKAGARTRQHQSRSVGWKPDTYVIVSEGRAVATVTPER